MKNVRYEKPTMKIIDLRSEQQIAGGDEGPCMSQASHGTKYFYYDWPGDGWVKIEAIHKNCSGAQNCIFSYEDNPNIPGELSDDEKEKAIAAATKSLEDAKQQFAGARLNPDPKWS